VRFDLKHGSDAGVRKNQCDRVPISNGARRRFKRLAAPWLRQKWAHKKWKQVYCTITSTSTCFWRFWNTRTTCAFWQMSSKRLHYVYNTVHYLYTTIRESPECLSPEDIVSVEVILCWQQIFADSKGHSSGTRIATRPIDSLTMCCCLSAQRCIRII